MSSLEYDPEDEHRRMSTVLRKPDDNTIREIWEQPENLGLLYDTGERRFEKLSREAQKGAAGGGFKLNAS